MTYSEKRKLYELIIWTIARIVKSSINQLNDNHLNESIININDISQQFIDAINCALNKSFDVLNEELKWTEETIRLLIKDNNITQCKELLQLNRSAYNAAKRLGILKELTKTERNNWTEENIRSYVRLNNIKTRSDLYYSSASAYNAANDLNILYDLFGEKEHKDWSEEDIKEIVLKNNIKTRKELEKYSSTIYRIAKRLNILDELFGEKKYHQWTKEECAALAKKCTFRSDFITKYPNAYDAARKHGWYEEITSHMPREKGEQIIYYHDYVIYAYEILEENAVYIGLTHTPQKRDREHRNPDKNRGYDSLALYCIEHHIDIPKMKILKDNLNSTRARELEIKYWHQYKDDGWKMINSEAKLGHLGYSVRKWTKESIIKYVNEHPEITSRKDLQKFAMGAYNAALLIDNLLYDLFGDKKYKDWSEENIRKYVSEHPEITSRTELRNMQKGAYAAAIRLGIIDDLFKKKHKLWNESTIRLFVEDNNITSRSEFLKIAKYEYDKAEQLGIIDELFPKNH